MESSCSGSSGCVVCRLVANARLRAHPPQGLLRQGLRVPFPGETEKALNGLDFRAIIAFEVGVATVHRELALGYGAGGFGGRDG